ncbi:hypothetical protein KP509_09G087400 [Ceratopteris richardii]|nr:hypothetical protein KP509_09G087400 [Ceratopteris richardii]
MHIYTLIHDMGLETHPSLGDPLVSALVEVGSLNLAQRLFDLHKSKSELSWNYLIIGFAKSGELKRAFYLYEKMQQIPSLSLHSHAMVALLNACGKKKEIGRGYCLHLDFARKGLVQKDLHVGSTLVDMYGRFGFLDHAQEVFAMLPLQSVVAWNALISGYLEHGYEEMAFNIFEEMQHQGKSPSVVTFICILKACVSKGNLYKGQRVHMDMIIRGLESSMFVGSLLVDMYSKCGLLIDAQSIFDSLQNQDMVSWTALIAGYGEHGYIERVLHLLTQMQNNSVSPTAVTYVCSLKACGRAGFMLKGQQIHSEVVKKGFDQDHVIGSTLVDMYAKERNILDAQCVFDKIQDKDMVLWTTLLGGYVDNGYFQEALKYFSQMQQENIVLEEGVFVCSLKACSGSESVYKGQEIHSDVVKMGFERRIPICNILVDMYAKCGASKEAQDVFDALLSRDVISWSALLAGHAQLGRTEHVIQLFSRMTREDIEPNLITFLNVINAYSNAGLVEEGQFFFYVMINFYSLIPAVEHFVSLIDLLSRGGLVIHAFVAVIAMPFHPTLVAWLTILAACRKWGNIDCGKHAFEQIISLNANNASSFLCMFNLYANADLQEEEMIV